MIITLNFKTPGVLDGIDDDITTLKHKINRIKENRYADKLDELEAELEELEKARQTIYDEWLEFGEYLSVEYCTCCNTMKVVK